LRRFVALSAALLLLGACRSKGSSEAPPIEARELADQATESAVPQGHALVAAAAPGSALAAGGALANAEPADREANAWTAGIVKLAGAERGVSVLTELRAARHDGFDRVVFEFSGEGRPSAHFEYVDRPVRRCGSGEPTEIAGDGWLSVTFEPAAAHTEAGAPTVAPRERQLELPLVRELELTCDFEAKVTVVLGTAAPNRYRVLELDAPPRIALDVRHR